MERKCDKCIHKKEKGCEKWNCEFEPKYADPTEDAGTLAEQMRVSCGKTVGHSGAIKRIDSMGVCEECYVKHFPYLAGKGLLRSVKYENTSS